MAGQGNMNSAGVRAPPPSGQHPMEAAGVAAPPLGQHKTGTSYQATPKNSSAGQRSTEVLHQTSKVPKGPVAVFIGGFAVVATVAYFTVYSKKKQEATATDISRASTGT